jgi:cyclopropane fatty-acyl-phospholipid synthase-like methyltransferase
MDARDEAWWEEYFDDDFLAIYGALLDDETTRGEVAAIIEILGLPHGAAVLDVACGWGRHAVPLAQAGLRVTGVDLSPTLLARAEADARAAGVGIRLVRADIRRLEWTSEFDAALSLFSSLGYFLSDEDDLRVLQRARAALRPGGTFILDTMHRDQLARSFVERDWWAGPEGSPLWVEREFDAVRGINHECLRWTDRAGRIREKRHALRVRCASEWDVLLQEAGFAPLEWLGGWDLAPFETGSERLIVVARAAP